MMNTTLLDQVRRRSWLYLSDEVAQTANWSLQELRMFAAGQITPTETQLRDLARRMHLKE